MSRIQRFALIRRVYSALISTWFRFGTYEVLWRLVARSFPRNPTFPQVVTVELTNHCQLRCTYCVSQRYLRRPAGYMDMEDFGRVLEQLKEFPLPIFRLVGGGEPTLHPMFSSALHLLRGVASIVIVVTNGMSLNKDLIEALLKSTVDMIEISVDADNAEEYESSRQGATFSTLIENVSRLRAERDQRASPLLIKFRVMLRPSQLSREGSILEFWKRYGDSVSVDKALKLFGSDTDLFVAGSSGAKCASIFQHIGIRYNGDIPLCDLSGLTDQSSDGIILGNIKNDRLLDVWRGPVISGFREAHRRGGRRKLAVCCRCPHEQPPLFRALRALY